MASRPLPGWLFMIVGLAVMGYSKFIEQLLVKRQLPANLKLFFWTGIVLLAFGAWREFAPRLRTKPKEKELVGPPPGHERHPHETAQHAHHPAQAAPGAHATHQHTMPQQHPSHPHEPTHKTCPRCHQPVPYRNRYCLSCAYSFYETN